MTQTFAIAKVKGYPDETVKLPLRGTDGSAGLDFYCPEQSSWFRAKLHELNKIGGDFKEVKDGIIVSPRKRVLIPSGLKVRLPPYTMFFAAEKSGLATKHGVHPTCRVVDSDYQGEIGIGIENNDDEPLKIPFGSKITQFILVPVLMDKYEVVSEEKLYPSKTDRGEGGFGSTGA